MTRPRTLIVALVATALAASGCGRLADLVTGGDGVFDSALPADEQQVPGPAYVLERGKSSRLVADGDAVPLAEFSEGAWTRDGHFVAYGRSEMRLHDRAGRLVRTVRGPMFDSISWSGFSVTPSAVSFLPAEHPLRIVVLSPDLTERRVIEVPPEAIETDQVEPGDAELQLHGAPITLDGVTWVEWSVNSEDDTKNDHGVLRISGEGDDLEVTEVLRNAPVVRLLPAHDGSALLMLRQRNGRVDCGGCTVTQDVVELDPATGEVVADYDMPPGYDKHWRVDAVDKVGDTVAVRFDRRVGVAEVDPEDDEPEEDSYELQLWTYDGEWEHLDAHDGTAVRWMGGGALVRTVLPQAGRSDGYAPYELHWLPDGVEGVDDAKARLLFDGASDPTCEHFSTGRVSCPLTVAPGSLLPRP